MTHEAIEQREGLKPCPFCGKRPQSWADDNHSTGWNIACYGNTACPITEYEVWGKTKADAIAAWNTRHQSTTSLEEERDALAKRVAALEAAIGEALAAPMIDHSERKRGTYDILRAALNTDPSHAE